VSQEKVSLGKLGQLHAPEVQQAIETVFAVAKKYGMPVGAFAATTEAASDFIARTASLLAFSTNALLLGTAAKRELGF
jgi:2-keto-3-deoxy-L-rhamnonate aldolase RhmA